MTVGGARRAAGRAQSCLRQGAGELREAQLPVPVPVELLDKLLRVRLRHRRAAAWAHQDARHLVRRQPAVLVRVKLLERLLEVRHSQLRRVVVGVGKKVFSLVVVGGKVSRRSGHHSEVGHHFGRTARHTREL